MAMKKITLESRVAQTQNNIFMINELILCSLLSIYLFYNNSLAALIWISNYKYSYFTLHSKSTVNATFVFK